MTGGVDSYTNAISNIYQDNFSEGIYTGKGIYDLETFERVMKGKIKENTVLSHDLLEGCFLRCGLASDIMLLDGYPSGYNSYITRLARWIRGDIQITPWIRSEELNKLSKYKIIDNIRRSLVEIFGVLNLTFLAFLKLSMNKNFLLLLMVTFLSLIITSILDVVNYIVFRKENIKVQKKFTKKIDGLTASIYRGIISIANLPTKAYISLVSIIKTVYRMKISKEHLLEWTTAEEAEKKNDKDLKSMYKMMLPNVVFGILGIVFLEKVSIGLIQEVIIALISCIWVLAPIIMYSISKSNRERKPAEKLNKEELEYVKKIAEDTWKFFSEYMNKENNYLPPDNFQESRRQKIVPRTSATNIGLGFLTVISAYDLGFITKEVALDLIGKSLETVEKLEKWNGHLYNWYNIRTLKPLTPKFVSTVDSGNFVRIYVYFKTIFRRF